jgi:hypothetical protein
MDPEDAPERHQDFWNAIVLYLMQGRSDQVLTYIGISKAALQTA